MPRIKPSNYVPGRPHPAAVVVDKETTEPNGDFTRRLGRFWLYEEAIAGNYRTALAVFAKVVPVHVEYRMDRRAFEVAGYSDCFDVLPQGEETPEYLVSVLPDKTVTFARQGWPRAYPKAVSGLDDLDGEMVNVWYFANPESISRRTGYRPLQDVSDEPGHTLDDVSAKNIRKAFE